MHIYILSKLEFLGSSLFPPFSEKPREAFQRFAMQFMPVACGMMSYRGKFPASTEERLRTDKPKAYRIAVKVLRALKMNLTKPTLDSELKRARARSIRTVLRE